MYDNYSTVSVLPVNLFRCFVKSHFCQGHSCVTVELGGLHICQPVVVVVYRSVRALVCGCM